VSLAPPATTQAGWFLDNRSISEVFVVLFAGEEITIGIIFAIPSQHFAIHDFAVFVAIENDRVPLTSPKNLLPSRRLRKKWLWSTKVVILKHRVPPLSFNGAQEDTSSPQGVVDVSPCGVIVS